MKNIITLLLGITAATTIVSCTEKKHSETAPKQFCLSDTMQHMIDTGTVSITTVDDEIQLSGEVSFNENKVSHVYSRSSGQVIECKVTAGDKVHAGQILAVVKSADVAANYADLNSAEADIKIAKRQLENAASLYQSGISSEKEYTEAKENYQKALAVKEKIEATIRINGGNGAKAGGIYLLTSPVDGYIVEKKVNEGSFIRQDMNDYLFTISDMKEVWVNANVFEADIPRVKIGLPVKVTTLAYPNKIFTGTINNISSVLDPLNKALRIRIRLENANMFLRPEMFTKVIVTNKGEGSAITVPTKAVIEENGKTFVVLYKDKCNMKVSEITVLKVVGDKTYIGSGAVEGDKVITKNALLIYDELTN